jgi:hypothetical protein
MKYQSIMQVVLVYFVSIVQLRPLFVIHNIENFTKKAQLQQYLAKLKAGGAVITLACAYYGCIAPGAPVAY